MLHCINRLGLTALLAHDLWYSSQLAFSTAATCTLRVRHMCPCAQVRRGSEEVRRTSGASGSVCRLSRYDGLIVACAPGANDTLGDDRTASADLGGIGG